jgi:hypothetical protein
VRLVRSVWQLTCGTLWKVGRGLGTALWKGGWVWLSWLRGARLGGEFGARTDRSRRQGSQGEGCKLGEVRWRTYVMAGSGRRGSGGSVGVVGSAS